MKALHSHSIQRCLTLCYLPIVLRVTHHIDTIWLVPSYSIVYTIIFILHKM